MCIYFEKNVKRKNTLRGKIGASFCLSYVVCNSGTPTFKLLLL